MIRLWSSIAHFSHHVYMPGRVLFTDPSNER